MALALGTATFAATDTASFTWVDAFTLAPITLATTPQLLATSVTSTDGTVQAASFPTAPTTSGGTVSVLGSFSGFVYVLATG